MFLPSVDVEENLDSPWGTDVETLSQCCLLRDEEYRANGSLLELARRFRLGTMRMFEFIDTTLVYIVS